MNSMKIKYNDVHPADMTEKIRRMMLDKITEISKMDNRNPVMKKCPVCYDSNIDKLARVRGYDMFQCKICGLIFCNPYPTSEQLFEIYNCEAKRLENKLFKATFEKRLNIFIPRVELIQGYANRGKLLDVGSAVGIFIEALKRKKMPYEVTCCELSHNACTELKKCYPSAQILNCDVMEIDESHQKNRYDIVTLWDTIEHIIDLNGMLRKIRTLLNNTGIFVFSTPNTDSFEWTIAGIEHEQLSPPTHLNLMNEKAIRILLSKNGFLPIRAMTLNASIDITYVKNLIEKNRARPEKLGIFLRNELYNPSFEKFLERYLIENNKAGNIVMVAKKM